MALDTRRRQHHSWEQQEVPPVHEQNAAGRSPFLLTCDHYGRLIPRALGDLGVPASELTRHIAWDIGIAGVAEALSKQLDAHLIAQRYSRLVIDCNRPPRRGKLDSASSAKPPRIPGNEGSDARGRRRRGAGDLRSLSSPHRRGRSTGACATGVPTVLVSLHSFTPVYAGVARPWHVATLYHRDTRLPPLLLKLLARRRPIWWSATTSPMR